MHYHSSVTVDKETAAKIKHAVTHEPTCEDEMFKGVRTVTVPFADGHAIDVCACGGSRFEKDACNTAWTQGVLFDPEGNEVASERGEGLEFFDDWSFEHEGNTYTAALLVTDD